MLSRDLDHLVLDPARLGIAPIHRVERVRAVAALDRLTDRLRRRRGLELELVECDAVGLEVARLRRRELDLDGLAALAGSVARVSNVDAGAVQDPGACVVDGRSVRLQVLVSCGDRRRCGEQRAQQGCSQQRWRTSAHETLPWDRLPTIA
jgi:hypothetical protein